MSKALCRVGWVNLATTAAGVRCDKAIGTHRYTTNWSHMATCPRAAQ